MTIRLPPGVKLGSIPAGGVLADSDWYGGGDDAWEPVSFAPKAVNGKTRIRLADLVKLGGPEGYIHGYICVRPPCGPQYKEAVHNKANGKILDGDGNRIGQQLKKNEGDAGYRARHFGKDIAGKEARTDLTAQYETRADTAKAVVLYHNVDKLHNETADLNARGLLKSARSALAAGDTDSAAMFLASAEARAGTLGDHRLESHIRDTRAAVVDGPRAINPPDVAGLRFESQKPVPVPPPAHAPLPESVRQKVNDHLLAMGFARHNQRVNDRITNAKVALDVGDSQAALGHLVDAFGAAFEADDRNALAHVAAAHELIAAHLGQPALSLRAPTGDVPAVPKVPTPPAPEPKVPTAPKVKRLPKAKAAVIDEQLASASADMPKERLVNDAIVRAQQHIKDGNLAEARHMIRVARNGMVYVPDRQAARDRLAMADEALAAHLKEAPLQARTVTHADEHALAISSAARNVMAVNLRVGGRGGLDYLTSKDEVAAKLRAGEGAQVIRDLRELDARAREQQNFEWNADRKAALKAARQNATAAKRDLEKLHSQDLSEQPFQDRAAKLAQDMAPHDRGWRPAAPPLRLAADELANGNLDNARRALANAKDAAASQPRVSGARQFEKDIADLHAEIGNAYLAQQAALLDHPAPEAATGAGILGDVQNERNQVRAQLATALQSGVKSRKAPTVRGAIGETSLVTFRDGSTWVHKRAGYNDTADSDKEELASMVARAAGVRAPSVVRDPLDNTAVYMTLVNGKTAAELGKTAGRIMREPGSPEAADMLRRIGFMDYLIKNPDRHSGNFMIDQDQMPVAIDHGNAWAAWPGGSAVSELTHKSDFSPRYYAQTRQNLEALQPEFSKVAGPDQKYYQTMMKQFDKWMTEK
jgi:hypothetical protein